MTNSEQRRGYIAFRDHPRRNPKLALAEECAAARGRPFITAVTGRPLAEPTDHNTN